MRFGFDWESGRSIKYDEQIRVWSIYKKRPNHSTFVLITAAKTQGGNQNAINICVNPFFLVYSSPGCWTWSLTPSLEWLVRTVAEKARAEEMGRLEVPPGRKLQFQRTMNLWESLSTAVRHMPAITTPSSRTDGKKCCSWELLIIGSCSCCSHSVDYFFQPTVFYQEAYN